MRAFLCPNFASPVDPAAASVKLTGCGLDILGGGRVAVHICPRAAPGWTRWMPAKSAYRLPHVPVLRHLRQPDHLCRGRIHLVRQERREDEPVFQAGRTIEYCYGRDSEGKWAEGDSKAQLTFRPLLAGTYTWSLEIGESGQWTQLNCPQSTQARHKTAAAQSQPALSKFTVSSKSGLSLEHYMAFWPSCLVC